MQELVLLVADISFLGGIEGQVADGSNQGVDTEGQVGQNEVCPGSGGVALGLEGSVVDDEATNEAQEEGQQETNQVLITHYGVLLSQELLKVQHNIGLFVNI